MSETESCKRTLEITIPVDEVEAETERVVGKIREKVRLPGFRPGKAPASLVKTRFQSDIRQEVLESLVPKAFRDRAERDNLKVVGTPDVTEVHYHPGEPLRFKAEFETAPEFDLGEYRGLEVEYDEPAVSEEDISKRIEEIRQSKAEFVNEDPREVADGDHAVVSLNSIAGVEGKPIEQDEMTLHVGDADTFQAFTENLRGMTPGGEKEFEVTYPEDYGQERLAGKTVKFHVVLKGIRRKEVPELNDEFAQDLGDYQNLGELREAIRKSIFAQREQEAQREAKEKLVDKLIDAHSFPVPEAYVEQQLKLHIERLARALLSRGEDPRKMEVDWNHVRETQRLSAVREVRGSLILGRIADREAIDTMRDELDREVQRLARQEREPVAAMRKKLEKDGAIGRIVSAIRTEKVLSFLFDQARKIPKPA